MMISSTTSMILLCTINVLLLHNAVNTNEVTDKDQSDEIEYSELDPETSIASKSFHLTTRVFNAFPKPDVSAFVLFEHDRISRLHYGQLSVINATLEPHSDFIIQFREMPTDIVHSEYTDFGFMESELHTKLDILLLIRRDSSDLQKPKHHLLTFDQSTVDIDSSKLYIYNALWKKKQNSKRESHKIKNGINIYGLYKRSNTDGSESESITQLTDNLIMNKGNEISIEPNKPMNIKVSYTRINSVAEFKSTVGVAELYEYMAAPGKREYLIVHGDYTGLNSSNVTHPNIIVIKNDVYSSGTHLIVSTIILTVIALSIITVIEL